MPWEICVHEFLMAEKDGKKMTSAAIFDHEGVVLAKSANFPKYKIKEIVDIMNAFENPQQLVRNDLRIGDTKYEVTQVEQEHVINGKKGTGGICVKKTITALLVGIYNEPMTGTACNGIVKSVAAFLIPRNL
ncbi:profilin-2-like [Salvia hispanica]|uniref:profilin-2-like n=1 Tax=Salvia hispanica TaxID=49212 RepID=UPI002009535B|nr:profilin-2-like [Salvia hispanica]